ncbi:MAG TPA: DUF2723 domain-containing protein [Gemmatimonadaceae bacterium]|nr:DUF2723 domain-containing protein [Gemmatimonadaceae bacterium]
MTFWDAGEFIAAADGLGIPHPPGTPLYVAVGRVWTLLLSPIVDPARAMNILSAVCTALAGALMAALLARETRGRAGATWGAVAGVACAGLMASVWSNATETEVYAVSLLHVVVLLSCAARARQSEGASARRWLTCTAYLIALAPAVHLSALVGAPAAIALAARRDTGEWRGTRVLTLGGALVFAAGVGRVSLWLTIAGCALMIVGAARARSLQGGRGDPEGSAWTASAVLLASCMLASSALLVMLVRARHDPLLNQGNPSTFAALTDVVARRQYDLASLLPRQAPIWLQLANVAQYADWQAALGWGHGIFTTPSRVAATAAFVLLAVAGARSMRRDARRVADALLVLLVCGTLGVAAYLNLKAGSSLGWGVIPDSAPHEARERDYFFVLGFWAWGCLVGYGAFSVVRARRWPAPLALLVLVIPLAGNWQASDRSREPRASAARLVAKSLLQSAPENAVLFVAGDNDSYPLWYVQQVLGTRRDVTLVTISLLPAEWYQAELRRRTGLRWGDVPVPDTRWQHEEVAVQLASAARGAGRPVAASPALSASERALLGSDWRLEGLVYVAQQARTGAVEPAMIDDARTAPWAARAAPRSTGAPLVDDVAAWMLGYLSCPLLRNPATPGRDSLEVRCNLR